MNPVVKSLSVERALGPSADKFLIKQPTQEQAEEAVRTLLLWAGDDPSREGLQDTPRRVAKAYKEFYKGCATLYRQTQTPNSRVREPH